MKADRAWVERNLGFDPIATPAPMAASAVAKAASPRGRLEDFQREIIEFDSEAPAGQAFLAFSTATGLSRFTDIPWPKNLAPKTDRQARKGKAGRLPRADVLVVTWTVDEGHALAASSRQERTLATTTCHTGVTLRRSRRRCAKAVRP